jgi:DNA polymerase III subunit delta'
MQQSIYAWQQTSWQHLNSMRNRLPHALLLYGQAGIGKRHFAEHLAQSLLCRSVDASGHACQTCSSCHWFLGNSHPDFNLLSPEEIDESDVTSTSGKKKTKKKQIISIAQIRALSNFVNLSSHHDAGLRIILIHPAESLNIASANALLKMLEEPAPNVIFILVCHHSQRLLPTILSRCHKIAMPFPSEQTAIDWLASEGIHHPKAQLAYYANAPLKALDEDENYKNHATAWQLLAQGQQLNPSSLISALSGQSVDATLIVLQKWLYDIVLMHSIGKIRYHQSQISALHVLASKVNLSGLFELQKKVESLRKLATHPLNHDLQLETLLFEYTKLFSLK